MFGSNFLGMGAEEDARQAMLAAGIDPDTGMPLASPAPVAPPPPAPAPQQAPIARQGTTFDIPKPDYSRVDALRKEMQSLRGMGWFPSASYQRGNLAQQQILAHEIDAEQRRAADEYEAQLRRQAYLEARQPKPFQPEIRVAGNNALKITGPGQAEWMLPPKDDTKPWMHNVPPDNVAIGPDGKPIYTNTRPQRDREFKPTHGEIELGAGNPYNAKPGFYGSTDGRINLQDFRRPPKPAKPEHDDAEDVNKDDAKALRKAIRDTEYYLATGADPEKLGAPLTPERRNALSTYHAHLKRKLRDLEGGRFSGMGGGTDQSASGASAESVGRTGATAPQQKKLGDPLGIR